jgi:hypothetical protein
MGSKPWFEGTQPDLARRGFTQRERSSSTFFAVFSVTGSVLAHHRRSLPMCRSGAHALLDKPAISRLCHAQKEA